MKRLQGNSGFALVETIICALFVASIFTILFTQLYPISGSFEATEYFDDIETKYIAHYLREIITTDRTWSEKTYLNRATNLKYSLFDILYDSAILSSSNNYKNFSISPDSSTSARTFCEGGVFYQLGQLGNWAVVGLNLSNEKSIDPDTHESTFTGRNNAYYCQQFVHQANISRVWFTTYDLTKTIEKNTETSNFGKYLKQLPTHSRSSKATSTNPRYMWMIVEVQHENKDSDKKGSFNSFTNESKVLDYYYTYAKIEVHE